MCSATPRRHGCPSWSRATRRCARCTTPCTARTRPYCSWMGELGCCSAAGLLRQLGSHTCTAHGAAFPGVVCAADDLRSRAILQLQQASRQASGG